MSRRKLYLWISAIGLIPVALSYGVSPEQSLGWLFGITVESVNHAHVVRGITGFYLAMVLFWVYGAVYEKCERAAIQSEIVFMAGLAVGRIASILVDGWPHWLLVGYALAEIALVVIGIILLKKPQLASASCRDRQLVRGDIAHAWATVCCKRVRERYKAVIERPRWLDADLDLAAALER